MSSRAWIATKLSLLQSQIFPLPLPLLKPIGIPGLALVVLLGVSGAARAASPALSKVPVPAPVVLDEGSFVLRVEGRPVSVETFSITSGASGSVTRMQIKSSGDPRSEQKAQLEMQADGQLQRYEWQELAPGKGHSLLLPDGSFLKQEFGATVAENTSQAYLLLPSTTVLDDNFFVLRELLMWRYLREFCPITAGQVRCPLMPEGSKASAATTGGPSAPSPSPTPTAALPVVVPLQRYSMQVAIGFRGRERISLRGVGTELLRFDLDDDTGQWTLWLDDSYKLQKIRLGEDGSEVERQ